MYIADGSLYLDTVTHLIQPLQLSLYSHQNSFCIAKATHSLASPTHSIQPQKLTLYCHNNSPYIVNAAHSIQPLQLALYSQKKTLCIATITIIILYSQCNSLYQNCMKQPEQDCIFCFGAAPFPNHHHPQMEMEFRWCERHCC